MKNTPKTLENNGAFSRSYIILAGAAQKGGHGPLRGLFRYTPHMAEVPA